MRVVVLGGAGFIGKNLAIYLKTKGYEVVVGDMPGTQFQNECRKQEIDYKEIDFITGRGLEGTVESEDVVIHLVSTSIPTSSNQNILKDAQENILGTLRLLDICVDKKVSKFIFASSGGQIYGTPEYVPLDELHPTNPASAYGVDKLAIEKYLNILKSRGELEVCSLRISNPYGPGQKPFRGQGVIPTFIASVLLDKEIEIWGDGETVRDYIYIDDLVTAFESAIRYTGENIVFNIGSGVGYSVNQILDKIAEITQKIPSVRYKEVGISNVSANVLECSRAYDFLGWRSQMDLDEGIQKMLNRWNAVEQLFE